MGVTLLARFREVGSVAKEHDLTLLNAHGFFTKNDDRGFVWWDKVHLTTFGQRVDGDLAGRGARAERAFRPSDNSPSHED